MTRFWPRWWLAAWTLGLSAVGAAPPGEAEHLRLTVVFDNVDVIERLQALGVERVAPSHCTGAAAIAHFRQAWGDRFVDGGLGAVIEVSLK